MNYYGDNDRRACAWLRELIAAGLIPEGFVDERPIQEVNAPDLAGYQHVHCFAGIAGWAEALRLAGWDATRPVWTCSCPCQPFSAAGKGKGEKDARHLWPHALRLVRECRPATVFGEQVASADGYHWLARIRDDLEEAGYAVGCADLPAACVGAPHVRQRLFWVADDPKQRCRQGHPNLGRGDSRVCPEGDGSRSPNGRSTRRLDDAAGQRAGGDGQAQQGGDGADDGVPGTAGAGRTGRLGDAAEARQQSPRRGIQRAEPCSNVPAGFWSAFDLVHCTDGKVRRVEPGTFPLAARLPGRVAALRGYGNSIVPQVAALFVRAFLEAEAEGLNL